MWEYTNHGNKLNMVVKTKTCDEFTRVKTLNEEVAIFVGTELAPYDHGLAMWRYLKNVQPGTAAE